MIVPDKIAPEVGWRCWFLSPVKPMGLNSMTQPLLWPYAKEVEADAPPSQGAPRGIHAARSLAHFRGRFRYLVEPTPTSRQGLPYVVGEVALWGEVVEGEWGLRAQYAFPRSLYLVRELWVANPYWDVSEATELLQRYSVPVYTVDSLDDIQAERLAA